jgi:competence protein ComEC
MKIPPFVLWMVLGGGLPLLWVSRGGRFFLPLFILLTAASSSLYTYFRYDPSLESVRLWEQSDFVYLEGVVASDVRLDVKGKRQKVSFVLSARNVVARKDGRHEYGEVRGRVQVFLFQPAVVPEYGDRVRVMGTLRSPAPALNPGNFDYRAYLEQRAVALILNGYGSRSIRLIEKGGGIHVLRIFHRIRGGIGRRLGLIFKPDSTELFRALIIGERKGIDSRLREDFSKTGTAHILPTAKRKRNHNPLTNYHAFATIAQLP